MAYIFIFREDKIMLELIKNINDVVNGLVWGVPAMVCIIGVVILL